MACWTWGALFALHTHCQPPQRPHCCTQGGLALLCPPPPLAPSPEAQLRVQARARLPPAVWRPLLLFPSLWHVVASSTIYWLSGTREHMLRNHDVALVTPPFLNPRGDMLWFWDAVRELPPAPTGILLYTRRGHEWFLDCNPPPCRVRHDPPLPPMRATRAPGSCRPWPLWPHPLLWVLLHLSPTPQCHLPHGTSGPVLLRCDRGPGPEHDPGLPHHR